MSDFKIGDKVKINYDGINHLDALADRITLDKKFLKNAEFEIIDITKEAGCEKSYTLKCRFIQICNLFFNEIDFLCKE